MQQSTISRTGFHRHTIAVVHIGFVLTGVVTVLLGPLLPVLQAKWALTDAEAGYLFTAQFTASITPLAAMSILIERFGLIRMLSCGYALMAAGVAGLTLGSWAGGITSVFCYGVGLGLVLPATNLLISDLHAARRAAALSIVNFTWGIGAVACAPLFGLLAKSGHTTAGLIAVSLLLALVFARMLKFQTFIAADKATRQVASNRSPFFNPFVPLIGTLIFLYVGTENAVAGWVATHAMRMGGDAQANWEIFPSVFWAALLTGRAAAPVALRRVMEEHLALAGLLAGFAGTSLLLLTNGMAGLIAGVALAGVGFASVYPITVAMFPRAFGEGVSRVAGLIFMLAGLGGATMTWAVGFVSTRSGSLRAGLLIPLVGSLSMIALQMAIIAGLRRRKQLSSSDDFVKEG